MGVYLGLYFGCLVLALALYSYSRRKDNRKIENLSGFFTVLMMFFLVFALYTDDPIESLLTTIPAFWQFVLTSLGGAFTLWQLYLNPLKEKVYAMDKDVSVLKTRIDDFGVHFTELRSELKNTHHNMNERFTKLDGMIEKLVRHNV